MKVYLVVVQDTIIQSREYAVLAKDEQDAKKKIAGGFHLTESEATTMDTLKTEIVGVQAVHES